MNKKNGDVKSTPAEARLQAVGDKLLARLDRAADGQDGPMDPLDLQRLAAALKTLRDVAQAGGEEDGGDGVTVRLEGAAKEAAG